MRTEPIRRHRAVQTCCQCRDAKVRCDRGNPRCSRCLRLSLSCLYSSADSRNSLLLHGLSSDLSYTSVKTATGAQRPSTRSSTALDSDISSTTVRNSGVPNHRLRAKEPTTFESRSLNLNTTLDISQRSLPPERNRGALTCNRCRKLKVRCDRERPCGRCLKFERDVYCSYGEKAVWDRPASSPAISESTGTTGTDFFNTSWAKKHRYTGHWTSLLHVVARWHPPSLKFR